MTGQTTSRMTVGAALLSAILLLGSCSVIFAPEPGTGPFAVYDALWSEFDVHYALFDERSVDWAAVRSAHRGRLSSDTGDDELFQVLSDSLLPLDDGHVKLIAPNRPVFEANTFKRDRPDFDLFDLSLIRNTYLERVATGESDSYVSGLVGGRIAYVHLPYIGGNSGEVPAALERFPEAVGLILDLRHNQGGDFTWAFSSFRVLTDQRRFVFRSRTKNGPSPNDFTAWFDWYLEPGDRHDQRPVVVLTDRYTISAGERAVMALAVLPQATIVGEPTNGAQSTMVGRELPNGWFYTLSVQEVRFADGESYEGIGLPVDESVTNTASRLASGIDDVLEHAVSLF